MEFFYKGYGDEQVADLSVRSRRTIQEWKRLFNLRGIDGLTVYKRPGRKRCIAPQRFREQILPLFLGPGGARRYWTAIEFHGHLTSELGEKLGYSTLLRYLRENRLVLNYPRRFPARCDDSKRAEFLEKIKVLASDPENILYFCDECGIEGDPRPRRIWVKKGSRPKTPYLGDHLRTHAVGAVAPGCGDFFSLVVPHSDREVFQVFLDQLAKHTRQLKKNIILVIDNAAWHKGKLTWHHLTPFYLPPYSPDLNPIEVLWRVLKERFFTQWYAKTPDQLDERLCVALKSFIDSPAEVSSITNYSHLLA